MGHLIRGGVVVGVLGAAAGVTSEATGKTQYTPLRQWLFPSQKAKSGGSSSGSNSGSSSSSGSNSGSGSRAGSSFGSSFGSWLPDVAEYANYGIAVVVGLVAVCAGVMWWKSSKKDPKKTPSEKKYKKGELCVRQGTLPLRSTHDVYEITGRTKTD